MNHKDKPDSDAMFESESPETLQQLEALEQRLRVTRPQLSRLDAATLMREADQRIVHHRPSVVLRSVWLAGSWASGMAIGALVMFVMMNHTASEVEPSGQDDSRSTVRVVDNHVPETPLSPGPRFEKEDANESSGAISMFALDLLDDSIRRLQSTSAGHSIHERAVDRHHFVPRRDISRIRQTKDQTRLCIGWTRRHQFVIQLGIRQEVWEGRK